MIETALLQGETCILSSNDGVLMLTNFRVKRESIAGSTESYKSIPLSKITGCALTTKKYPFLLVLATLAVIGALASSDQRMQVMSVLAGVVLGVLFLFARSGQLEIFSGSGSSIAVPTKGLKHAEVRRFAEAIALEVSRLP